MLLVSSPIVNNMPTRTKLAVETTASFVQWLANLNIKRNVTSMFVNKKYRYGKTEQSPAPKLSQNWCEIGKCAHASITFGHRSMQIEGTMPDARNPGTTYERNANL